MNNIEFKVVSNDCCTPSTTCGSESATQDGQLLEMKNDISELPVAIIGAGPVGLAAAAELAIRKQSFIVFESGSRVGHNIREWGHVRLFSPWQYNMDKAAQSLLHEQGWVSPSPDELPLGKDIVDKYLEPLAAHPSMNPNIMYNSKILAVSRKDTDKMKSANREKQPFVLYVETEGKTTRYEARAVIDASGTWGHSNPLVASGIWTEEERSVEEQIYYGIPELNSEHQTRYKGKRIAVVGSGHSALNTLLDLVQLKEADPSTELYWIMRKRKVEEAYGGEGNDQLEARGELGSRIHQLVSTGQIHVVTPFKIEQLIKDGHQIQIMGTMNGEESKISHIDEIIVNTGSRPDFSFLEEIRLSIDPATESTLMLAPLIDPNVHSCGTVRPHGQKELQHQEKDFYIVGMKSYGRAPTFLMATGYEQVRSIAAFLAGDLEGAANVELDLPETGVCSINNASASSGESCCSVPATQSTSCCN
ncbi:SidA/IucD/PvdA family monooxygenase [Paenibacillus sp. HJL G12]|uniref:SidA/IucD/PvdA family monooxygenase n=1 Tax=Paenibacillus dendrobii TaxID=2691084 RepID=A0A7X3IG22_9BACL|nr:NAD(P)-binding domain-containing protein [Paenibacillus dendrobii]MWV42631.1 SidA/IucD/PvdA family monooxygenase [Paenibacillus dendrobii]